MSTAQLDLTTDPTQRQHNEAPARGGKYLTFRLDDVEYGLEILKVREINGLTGITAVPRMPEYITGVINLRGKVIPVIDLRLKFGMIRGEHTEQTCVIVVDVGQDVGIMVDTVSEVLDIADGAIEPAPAMGATVDTSFILGMGKINEQVKILLDIERVVDVAELRQIADHVDPGAPART